MPIGSSWKFGSPTSRRIAPSTIRLSTASSPHVTRACEGVVFESVPLVKQLIERTQTRTGLQVTVDIIDRVYETGRKAALDLKASLRIVADALLPPWNYTILPNSTA
ncbi:hypothetical protein E4Q08_21135 [Candidatus Accumulibacter phosphatis]|uniref:Uncharacterized protein n=1 Tax=Candidatus Accumulibacter contiguus TaxID=2954381 RepID=A0ABX1TCZ5_9PROT|nr:hypothetical protein [Candidatus Accumulibacter contiguus]NMQ07564.1 hypothetical protein [Candidatus Accumulibacter contiguus]